MLYFFFLKGLSFGYLTADELSLRCTLCKKIISYHSAHPDEKRFRPIKDSYCSNNEDDPWCKYITSVSSDYFKLTSQNAKDKYCYQTVSCFPNVTGLYDGNRCQSCVDLASLLLLYDEVNRTDVFNTFCITSKLIPSSLCGDIIDDGLDDFMKDLQTLKDSIVTCKSLHYCRPLKDSYEDL